MEGPRDCHTEWSKSDREGEISYAIPYTWILKRNDTDDSKWKETHRLGERPYGYQREIWGKRTVREFGMGMYTLMYLKQIANNTIHIGVFKTVSLLPSTWKSARCSLAAWTGGEFGREWIYVYAWLSPFCVHLKPTIFLISLPQYKIQMFTLKNKIEKATRQSLGC